MFLLVEGLGGGIGHTCLVGEVAVEVHLQERPRHDSCVAAGMSLTGAVGRNDIARCHRGVDLVDEARWRHLFPRDLDEAIDHRSDRPDGAQEKHVHESPALIVEIEGGDILRHHSGGIGGGDILCEQGRENAAGKERHGEDEEWLEQVSDRVHGALALGSIGVELSAVRRSFAWAAKEVSG